MNENSFGQLVTSTNEYIYFDSNFGFSKSRNKMHTEMFLYILILNCSFLERVSILSMKIFIHWWDPEKCKTCVRMYPKDNWNYDFGYYL